jgi:hypothetical protein
VEPERIYKAWLFNAGMENSGGEFKSPPELRYGKLRR